MSSVEPLHVTLGLGDMSKNSYLGIFGLICGIRYISRYLYTFVLD